MTRWAVLLAVLLSTASADELARPVSLRLADGSSIEGRLAGYDPPGVWRLATDGGERLFPRRDVADVVFLDAIESLRRGGRLAPPLPDVPLDDAGLASLQKELAGLVDPTWDVRQRADASLRALGRPALEPLRKAGGESTDPEARLRVEAIVRALEFPGSHGTLSLRQDLVLIEAVRPARPARSAARPVRFPLLQAGRGPLRLAALASAPGLAMAHVVPLGRVRPIPCWVDGQLAFGERIVSGYELFARPTDPAPIRFVDGAEVEAGASYLLRGVRPDQERLVLLTVIDVTATGVAYSLQVLYESSIELPAVEGLPSEGEVVLWDANATGDRLKASFSFRGATRDRIGSGALADVVFGARKDGRPGMAVADRRFGIRKAELDDWTAAGIEELAGGGYEGEAALEAGGVYAVRMDRPEGTGAFFEVVEMSPTEGDSPGWIRIRWRRV